MFEHVIRQYDSEILKGGSADTITDTTERHR